MLAWYVPWLCVRMRLSQIESFDGVLNNQIKKCLLVSLSVKKKLKIGEHLAKLQART